MPYVIFDKKKKMYYAPSGHTKILNRAICFTSKSEASDEFAGEKNCHLVSVDIVENESEKNLEDKKRVSKKELKKVKSGTLLRVRWDDDNDTVALLVEAPDWNQKGDISLKCFQVNDEGVGFTDNHIQHTQVVEIISLLDMPLTKVMFNHQELLSK